MMNISKLTYRQREALLEFKGKSHWFVVPWKPKTMQSLLVLGLTRVVVSLTDQRPHYALTDVGREVLAELIEEKLLEEMRAGRM